VPDRAGTIADPPSAAVVTTGLDDGGATETVVTGVAALTVVVGTVGTLVTVGVVTVGVVTVGVVTVGVVTVGVVTVGVVTVGVVTVGVVTVGVVTVGVVTVGTVVGTVVDSVGTVTIALSGLVASTFATKKPDTAKQKTTTIALYVTTFSPRQLTTAHQQETA
jgi:hypothetical protein